MGTNLLTPSELVLYNAAMANNAFVPSAGQIAALILLPTAGSGAQLSILECVVPPCGPC